MSEPPTLLTRAEIDAMDRVDYTHGLNPGARRRMRSLGDLTGLTGLGVHLFEVEPGDETTEHHLHHNEDEAVYVLSGTATAFVGDAERQIGPGDFLGYRKGGPAHSIRNTGTEVLRYLVIGQRLPSDVVDYPRRGKRLFRVAGVPETFVDLDTPTTDAAGRKSQRDRP